MPRFDWSWISAIFVGLALFIAIFGFGGVYLIVTGPAIGALAVAALVWMIARLPGAAPPTLGRFRWLATLIMVLSAWQILQVTPLPFGMVELLSPRRAADATQFAEARGVDAPSALTLALNPIAAQQSMVLWCAGLLAFLVGAGHATKRRMLLLTRVALWVVVAQALYALFEAMSGRYQIYGVELDYVSRSARGSFVNRNNFATMIALATPPIFGLLYYRLVESYDEDVLRDVRFWVQDLFKSHHILGALPLPILTFALLLTHSRAGVLVTLAGVLALVFSLSRRGGWKRVTLVLAPILAIVVVVAMNAETETLAKRFEDIDLANEYQRPAIWRNSVRIALDYPLAGVGSGNFAEIYKRYSPVTTINYAYQAHNEWLEAIVSFGFVGGVAMILGVVTFMIQTLRKIHRDRRNRAWLLGIWWGLFAAFAHAGVSFPFHLSSLTILCGLFAGMLAGYEPEAEQD